MAMLKIYIADNSFYFTSYTILLLLVTYNILNKLYILTVQCFFGNAWAGRLGVGTGHRTGEKIECLSHSFRSCSLTPET